DNVGRERDQFRSGSANGGCIRGGPAGVNLHVAADGPARLLQLLQERPDPGLKFRIVAVAGRSMPMRRMRSGCCGAASGHETVASLAVPGQLKLT
ncbi:MAG: hypothetical protein WCB62_17580, partial [Pseudolabrys sp.]